MRGLIHRSTCAFALLAASCGDNLDGNTAPTVGDLNLTTDEDVAITRALDIVDAQNDTIIITLGMPANGTVTLSGTSFTYTPSPNYAGSDAFTVTVSDGALSGMGTVNIQVVAVNDAPIGGPDSFATQEDTAHTAQASALLANDTDVDGDTLTITSVGSPTNGTVQMSGSDIIYSPGVNFAGTGSYRYTISDGTLTADVTVTIAVGGVNDAPIAFDDSRTTAEDTPLVVSGASLVANDFDAENQTLTVTDVSNPMNGTVMLASGSVTFTPAANFHGTASFDYEVSDGMLTDIGRVTVTVTPVNDAPVAVDDSGFTTSQDTPIDIPASALLSNDTDVDTGTTLTIASVQNGMNGSATLGTGSPVMVTFTPAASFAGTATFEYTVSDGSGGTDVGLVSVMVTACTPVNDNIACTMDVCQNGAPVHIPNHMLCENDGFACTVPTCSTTTGCSEAPMDVICDDGATCTTEVCDPSAGGANSAGCVITPSNAVCNDTLACTTDVCSPGAGGANPTTGCVNTSTCSDSIACTDDTCGSGGCTFTPNDANCPTGDICLASLGCRTPPSALVITELGILGSGTAEMIELHNPAASAADLDGIALQNMAGSIVTIRAASDPTGVLGTRVTLAAGGYAWGVPNPANSADIPAGATFVYGDPGTTFAFADAGDLVTVTGQDTTLLDMVDFTMIHTNPTTLVPANAFPAVAGKTTQLHALALTALANDDGDNWCTPFRVAHTRGAANQSCATAVINEVLIDVPGTDDGLTFVELAGPGGGQIGGAVIEDIEGKGASVGMRNATAQTIPAGTRIPLDGLLVVADELGTSGTTMVANADVILNDVDLENSGGDAIQLVLNGALLDVLGHDVAGAPLDAMTSMTTGFAMYETATAIYPGAGATLARDATSTDTDHNANDFHIDPTPTPGAVNAPVVPTITSITPDDGLASTTTPSVRIVGVDLAGGATITVNGVAATACSFAGGATGATCTFPASAGGAVGRVNVVYTNSTAQGGGVATAVNGWTYTGVLNETNAAAEADFCNLQFPSTLVVQTGQPSGSIFGRIFEAGLTDVTTGGPAPGIFAEVGYGPSAANPTTTSTWLWFPTTFNLEAGNDDEYMGSFTAPAAGSYRYTYRFSFDGGLNFTYCDLDGAGSNGGLDFNAAMLGAMTVTP